MTVAEKLLMARDLEGCKEFSSQALAADPRTPGAEDLHAAADVLLSAQRRRIPNGLPDPYAVLGLDPATPASRDRDAIHSHYRRLSLLLNRSQPDRPCSVSIAEAAGLVAESWAFLSDAELKSALDTELDAAAARAYHSPAPIQQQHAQPPPPPQRRSPLRAAPQPVKHAGAAVPPVKPAGAAVTPVKSGTLPSTFWAVCRACCHIHQYDRLYEARRLKCSSCRQPFVAEAMAEPPPIVPGTDMYYCTWGFFPIGFPGCPGFEKLVNSQLGEPDQLNQPWLGANGGVEANGEIGVDNGTPVSAAVEIPEAPEPLMRMRVGVPAAPEPVMHTRVQVPAMPEPVMPMRVNSVKVGAKKRGRPKGSKNKMKS